MLNVFSSPNVPKWSWFFKLRNLSRQYSLPHPLIWLNSPPEKFQLKKICKSAVMEFWRIKLSNDVHNLSSLKYLKPDFLSLSTCHPIFTSCGANRLEVTKATLQARLLSGRYKFERLARFYSQDNKNGLCKLPLCWGTNLAHTDDVEAFLLSCPSISNTRLVLNDQLNSFCHNNQSLGVLIRKCLKQDTSQFLLDCSVMSEVIAEYQCSGNSVIIELFKLTRNYCFILHQARINILEKM